VRGLMLAAGAFWFLGVYLIWRGIDDGRAILI
jgi:hypothetical protein